MAIVGILALAAMPVMETAIKRRRKPSTAKPCAPFAVASTRTTAPSRKARIERKTGESGYPQRLEDLDGGAENITDPNKAKIYFLRRLPA